METLKPYLVGAIGELPYARYLVAKDPAHAAFLADYDARFVVEIDENTFLYREDVTNTRLLIIELYDQQYIDLDLTMSLVAMVEGMGRAA